jgi:hypothetical protein
MLRKFSFLFYNYFRAYEVLAKNGQTCFHHSQIFPSKWVVTIFVFVNTVT